MWKPVYIRSEWLLTGNDCCKCILECNCWQACILSHCRKYTQGSTRIKLPVLNMFAPIRLQHTILLEASKHGHNNAAGMAGY